MSTSTPRRMGLAPNDLRTPRTAQRTGLAASGSWRSLSMELLDGGGLDPRRSGRAGPRFGHADARIVRRFARRRADFGALASGVSDVARPRRPRERLFGPFRAGSGARTAHPTPDREPTWPRTRGNGSGREATRQRRRPGRRGRWPRSPHLPAARVVHLRFRAITMAGAGGWIRPVSLLVKEAGRSATSVGGHGTFVGSAAHRRSR